MGYERLFERRVRACRYREGVVVTRLIGAYHKPTSAARHGAFREAAENVPEGRRVANRAMRRYGERCFVSPCCQDVVVDSVAGIQESAEGLVRVLLRKIRKRRIPASTVHECCRTEGFVIGHRR